MSNKKIFFRSAMLGYVNMFLTMIIGIISQPMMLKQLGVVEFGIWSLTLNLLTYIGNSNVGIPGAALVAISKSKNNEERKNIVIKSLNILILISIFILVVFLLINKLFPKWFLILGKFETEIYSLVSMTMFTSIVLFLIRSPLQLAQSAFSGFQQIHITKIYEAINIIVPFIGLIFITIFNKNVLYLSVFVGIGYIIVNFVALIHLLYKNKINIFKKYTKSKSNNISNLGILKSGYEFFIIGIGFVIIYNTDNLIISNLVSVDKITNYNFAFKLYQMAIQILNVFTGIAFALYGRAYSNNDFKWIKKIYNNFITLFPIYAGAIWIGGILVGRDILDIWSGSKLIFENYALLVILGAFIYSLSIVNVHSTLLSGIDKKKEVAILIWIEAIVNLIISIILAPILGITGVALGTCIASISVPFMLLPKYLKKNTDSQLNFEFKIFIRKFIVCLLPFLIIAIFITKWLYIQKWLIKVLVVLGFIIIYFIVNILFISKKQRAMYYELVKLKVRNILGKF